MRMLTFTGENGAPVHVSVDAIDVVETIEGTTYVCTSNRMIPVEQDEREVLALIYGTDTLAGDVRRLQALRPSDG